MKLSREVKIGLFFIIIIIAMLGLLNFLKGRDIFKSTNHYYAIYESVEGLTANSSVLLKGLKIGTVEQIFFDQSSQKFVAKMNIKNTYHIPKDSEAQIFSTNIMGNKAIRIIFSDHTIFLQKGDTLKAGNIPELSTLIADELIPLKQKVDTLVTNLNTVTNTLNHVLNHDTQENILASITYLRQSMYNFQRLSVALEAEKENVKEILEHTNIFIAGLQQNSENITRTLQNLASITDSLQAARIDNTIKNLHELLLQANNQEGSIGKLLHNDDLYNNTTKAIAHLDSLILAIQKNPKKYVKISIF